MSVVWFLFVMFSKISQETSVFLKIHTKMSFDLSTFILTWFAVCFEPIICSSVFSPVVSVGGRPVRMCCTYVSYMYLVCAREHSYLGEWHSEDISVSSVQEKCANISKAVLLAGHKHSCCLLAVFLRFSDHIFSKLFFFPWKKKLSVNIKTFLESSKFEGSCVTPANVYHMLYL